MDKLNMTFESKEVLSSVKLQKIPTKVDELVEYVNDMASEVFPLTVSYASKNSGVYEVGTSVTPAATLNITRKGVDVSGSASLSVSSFVMDTTGISISVNSNNKAWSATAKNSGHIVINTKVTQGGQTVDLGNLTWTWTYYRYYGATTNISPTEGNIKSLATKQLSTTATLGETSLAAGKSFLFAVHGTSTLVCRHAKTDGIINGCTTGTTQFANGLTYSYIIIPAATSAWSFKITNS